MFGAGFHLDPVKDVPRDAQRQAAGISLEIEQEELKEAQSLVDVAERFKAEYLKKFNSVIGDKNLDRYLKLRDKLRQHVRDVIRKAPPTAAGEAEILKVQDKAADESRKFLGEIGFDMTRASKLQKEYRIRVYDALSEVRGKPEEPNYLVLPEMVPKDIRNPWVSLSAPYPGWAWAYSWYKTDEPSYPTFARYLDAASGEIGTSTHIQVTGADNSDKSFVRYRTGIRFWFRLPAAGMAEVWLHMQCINTTYSGYFYDEWGISWAACNQESHAYLRVIVPEPDVTLPPSRKSTILDYRKTGRMASWVREIADPGDSRWCHLFSVDVYPGGTWLLLEVGTEEWNEFWTNDVSIRSNLWLRWFLKRVYVRSSGE